ncbi:hypothetical protein F1E88_03375 [Staphylococcus aureus]|nr:hypothetical protein S103564_0818 [Staphylococcus aureus subsp. aureus 103564]MBD6755756.1 hypothetical protein [Staphylococcus aureus]MBD6800611.1 hypothetical protein [Staphylococcus aureus]NKI83110.1 hypothetical protein [Staphylococcus aureus]HAR7126823.1 hypothetical protein [Staphylococcus aureus]
MYESNSTQTIKPSRSLLWSDIDGFFCCLVNVNVYSFSIHNVFAQNGYINKRLGHKSMFYALRSYIGSS